MERSSAKASLIQVSLKEIRLTATRLKEISLIEIKKDDGDSFDRKSSIEVHFNLVEVKSGTEKLIELVRFEGRKFDTEELGGGEFGGNKFDTGKGTTLMEISSVEISLTDEG